MAFTRRFVRVAPPRVGRSIGTRVDLGWVNHLQWVVKVIQITSFRVVMLKVIQILPNLAVDGTAMGVSSPRYAVAVGRHLYRARAPRGTGKKTSSTTGCFHRLKIFH